MRLRLLVLVGTLAAALVAAPTAAAPPPTPTSSGSYAAARLVTLTVGTGGRVEVVAATPSAAVRLPASESPAQARGYARRTVAADPDADVVTVEVLDAAGRVTYRRSASVARTIRAELPPAGSDVLTGRTAPVPEATITVGLPAAGVSVRATSARSGVRSAAVPLAAPARAGGPTLVPLDGYPAADPANRLDVVILGDGYTAAQAGAFAADAKRVADGLLDSTPYSDYAGYLNVVGVFAPSAQSGADHPAYSSHCNTAGTSHPISCCPDAAAPTTASYADTRYDSSYCYFGIQRLLVPIDAGRVEADASATYPEWDQLLVVVNDEEYGGSGGEQPTTSLHPDGLEVIKHELGHGLLGLDDEYTDYTPGYPPCSDTGRSGITEPCAPNVTDARTRAKLKWRSWVDDATPIPTPSPRGPDVVGLFEGAHYSPTTWYRSCDECLMRFLERPFGAVAAEQLPVRLYSGGWQGPSGGHRIELIEPGSAAPAAHSLTVPPGEDVTLSVRVLSPAGAGTRVMWLLDGAAVHAETVGAGDTSTYTFTGDGFPHTVRAGATDVAGILHPSRAELSHSARGWQVRDPRTPVELLGNGGFEKPLTSGWHRRHVPTSARYCSGRRVADGRCALLLSAYRSGRSLTAHVGAVDQSGPGDVLELGGALDAIDLRARLSVTAAVVLADGSRHRLALAGVRRDPRDRDAYVVRRSRLTLTAPVASATVRVSLGRGSGRVRIDAVRLRLLPAG